MADFWEIEFVPQSGDSERKDASEWGVTVASRQLQSLAPDVVELALVVEPVGTDTLNIIERDSDTVILRDASPLVITDPGFSYKDTIIIYRDSVKWFQGVITRLPWEGDPDGEQRTFEVSGPWWFLENIVFQQNWAHIDAENPNPEALITAGRSRVLLGMDDDGSLITTGAQIDAILAYAATASGLGVAANAFVIGTTLAGQQAWSVEARDKTCAEVVRALLRWHPDAISRFDYSTSIPTLHIEVPSSTIALDVNDRKVIATRHAHRADLIPPSVVFKYEKDHDFDGSTYTTVEVDAYPEGTTGSEPGAIVATIPLRGAQRTTQKQRVKVRTIPTVTNSVGGQPELEEWWADHLPWLAAIDDTAWIIGGHEITFARVEDPVPPVNPNAFVVDSTDVDDYPRELLDGTIEDWMNARAERLIVKAVVAYDGPDTAEARATFSGEEVVISGKSYPAVEVAVEITGTDATSKLYSKVVASSPPESTPTGLAAAYWTALQKLKYEGVLTLTDDESGSLVDGLGTNVSLADGAVSMLPATPIQTLSQDLMRGVDRVVFGPAEHLSPQDFLESLRIARMLPKRSFSVGERNEAEPASEGSGESIGGHQGPRSNTVTKPGVAQQAQGFGYTILPDSYLEIEIGDLTEDGKTVHACDPGPAFQITSGTTQQLWVSASTDIDGTIQGDPTVSWRTSPPTGLKVHRQAKTTSEGDAGDTGEYAWHILDAINTAGKIAVTYYRHAIEYYSDRSAKSWAAVGQSDIPTSDDFDVISGEQATGYVVASVTSEDSGAKCTKIKRHSHGYRRTAKTLTFKGTEILGFEEFELDDVGEDPVEIADVLKCGEGGNIVNPAGDTDFTDTGDGYTFEEPLSGPVAPSDPTTTAPNFIPKDILAPGTGVIYGARCVDSSGVRAWPELKDVPAIEYPEGLQNTVDDVNGYTGSVVLDADDLAETATREFVTPAQKADIDHTNRLLLDSLTDSGDANNFLNEAGGYTQPPAAMVDTVNTHTGDVVLGADDIEPSATRKWITQEKLDDIDLNTADRHTDNANRLFLDTLTNLGSSANFLDETGTYREPPYPAPPVTTVNTYDGDVVLGADDIAPSATRKWITQDELDDIPHANRALLDALATGGAGNNYLNDAGGYTVPDYPVLTVNTKDGDITLTTADIADTVDKRYVDDATHSAITHANRLLLDSLTDIGASNEYLAKDGEYRAVTHPDPPVLTVNTYDGAVVLGADDIAPSATRKWITQGELDDIALNTADRHTDNPNRIFLDTLTDLGSSPDYLAGDGQYKAIDHPTPPVFSVNNQTQTVVLDADDIAETATKNFVTPAQKTDIDHTNRAVLDIITDGGTATNFLDETGAYSEPPYPAPPVLTVNTKDGAVVLDTSDIADTVDKRYVDDATHSAITHTNRAALDLITNGGTGGLFLADDGVYKEQGAAPVISVNTYDGAVVIDADDIEPTATRKWITQEELDDIPHTNRALLDQLATGGAGNNYLNDAGGYTVPDFPVDSVNGTTGAIVLTTADIADTLNKRYVDDAQEAAIEHANRAVLDIITDGGTATNFLDETGAYSEPPYPPAPVLTVNTYDGAVVLGADDIEPSATRKWITQAELDDIGLNKDDRHTHPNQPFLDTLTDLGSSVNFLDETGTYREPPYPAPPVLTVNTYDGAVVLTTADIADAPDKRYITEIERLALDDASNKAHTHTNETLLDSLTDAGPGDAYLANDGAYKGLEFVTQVNGNTGGVPGEVTLTTADVADSLNKRYVDDAQEAAITHTNRAALDIITDGGTGGLFLADDGSYKPQGAAPVLTVNTYDGAVVLGADDIEPSATRKWITQAELDDIPHTNRALLDQLTDGGAGNNFWNDAGEFAVPAYPVRTVNTYDGDITLTTADIADAPDKRYITEIERQALADASNKAHTHTNETLLNSLTSAGSSVNFLDETGNYREPPYPAAPVLTVNTYDGAVVLGADDIEPSATRKWASQAELDDIALNTADRHTDNANRALLDTLTDLGSAAHFLNGAGDYIEPVWPVTTVNNQTGGVVLTTAHIADAPDKRYITEIERLALDDASNKAHTHANETLLDSLTTAGSTANFLNEAGGYSKPPSLVDSVNTQSGAVVLDADDISDTPSRKWLTGAERTSITKIPEWWPKNAPADGTYVSFTVTGGSVTFNT